METMQEIAVKRGVGRPRKNTKIVTLSLPQELVDSIKMISSELTVQENIKSLLVDVVNRQKN